jgi:hypothetical protein
MQDKEYGDESGCKTESSGDTREGDAEWDARAEGFDGNLLKMATSFGTPLESKFSCFAKFSRMTTSFGKLLELLYCIKKQPKTATLVLTKHGLLLLNCCNI